MLRERLVSELMSAVANKRTFGPDKSYQSHIKAVCHRHGENLKVGQRIIQTQKQKMTRNEKYIPPQMRSLPFIAVIHKKDEKVSQNIPLQAVKRNLEFIGSTAGRPCTSNEMLSYIRGSSGQQTYPLLNAQSPSTQNSNIHTTHNRRDNAERSTTTSNSNNSHSTLLE